MADNLILPGGQPHLGMNWFDINFITPVHQLDAEFVMKATSGNLRWRRFELTGGETLLVVFSLGDFEQTKRVSPGSAPFRTKAKWTSETVE
jgi:hypothetical protein